MESKFLDQDVDVVSLANKGIVIGCFVGRNYNKILMETGKLTDNIRVTKNGLGSGVDRMFQSSDSAFYHFTDRLNPFGKTCCNQNCTLSDFSSGPSKKWTDYTVLFYQISLSSNNRN